MDIERISEELSELVWSEKEDPLKNNRLLELIIKRNEILLGNSRHRHKKLEIGQYENVCELLISSTQIPLELRAYHAGPPNQEILESPGIEFNGHSTDHHVYFSLDLSEVARDYILPENCRERVVYVIDLRNVKKARVQTSYSSETLWNDKIRTLIECYKDSAFMNRLMQERWENTKYAEPFKNKTKEELKEAILEEIQTWLQKFTIPFKLKHLNRYKKKRQDFILIPSPIGVIFPD